MPFFVKRRLRSSTLALTAFLLPSSGCSATPKGADAGELPLEGITQADASAEGGLAVGQAPACLVNSDCSFLLVCALGKCRVECVSDADCGIGGSCVTNGSVAVCQTPTENNTPCDTEAECPAPLACASDHRCRNLCTVTADCNVLGVMGHVCAEDQNGIYYCAAPADVTANNGGNGSTISEAPPPGAEGGVIEPVADSGASSSSDATTGDGSSSTSAVCTTDLSVVCAVGSGWSCSGAAQPQDFESDLFCSTDENGSFCCSSSPCAYDPGVNCSGGATGYSCLSGAAQPGQRVPRL
jgi:hypothetical protein